MNLEQIVKETVAKFVAEKQGKDLTGDGKIDSADYLQARSNAIEKAKGLDEDYEVAMAQDSLDSIIRAAMMLKTQMGDQEINLPAWIQDHITNSENYINQAAKGYHESDAQMDDEAGAEEMNEARVSQDNVVNYLANALQSVWNAGKGNNSIDFQDFAQSLYFDMFGGEEMNEGYNSEQSAIESASGDKITGTEEDDEGNTLYIGQDPYDQYFIVNLTSPKKIYVPILKQLQSKLKKKDLIINFKSKKYFNGCRPAKKKRKKQKSLRIFK